MATQQKKILIVDTDQFIIRTLTSKLEGVDLIVDSADQSSIAIEKLEKEKFDLVVLEMIVPLFSGYEILDYLKKSKKNKTKPVVILTNLQQEDDIKRSLEYEVVDYILKNNVDLIAVVKTVKEAAENKRKKLTTKEKESLATKLITISQQNSATGTPKIKILKCVKCEATLPPKTEFCPYCGTKVEEEKIIKQNY